MKVSDSVRMAIDSYEAGEVESAMLHACMAVDGTAGKLYNTRLGNNARFTQLLRDNYYILGPMGAPGINLYQTRFPVKLRSPKAFGGKPDYADVVYGIHRCTHGHGDELPDGFELLTDSQGKDGYTRMTVARTPPDRGRVQLSDRVIFGLLAVAVLSPVNKDQRVPDGYHLTFGRQRFPMLINDWWCRATEFPAVAAQDPVPTVTLDFGDMMTDI
jgi:hypothetical protein